MTTRDILIECQSRGIELIPSGDTITVSAPTGGVPDRLLSDIKANKPELLNLLSTDTPVQPPAHLRPEPGKANLKPEIPSKQGFTITMNGVTMPLNDWTVELWEHVVDREPVSVLFPMTAEQYRLYRAVTGRPDTEHKKDPSWCLSCQHHRCPKLVLECHQGDAIRRVIDLAACPLTKWSRSDYIHSGREVGQVAEEPGACPSCRGVDFWQSVHGKRICRLCHPPVPGAEIGADSDIEMGPQP